MQRTATALMFVLCLPGARACADDPRPVTAVTALPRPLAATRQACTVRGVVIGILPAPLQWILEDESGGIRVIPPATAADPADEATVAVGDEIEVSGETETGDFAPCLRARRVVRHGRPSARSPRRCDADSFFAGREDCRLVEIEGVVQQVWHESGSLCMEIETAGRLFTAALPATLAAAALDAVEQDPQALVDATVRVAGPTVSLCNPRGEITRPWVLVERPDGFTVTSTAVTVAESAVPLDWIGTFTPEGDARRRILTFGTVIHAIQGRVLYLQNGHRGITVRLGAGAMGTAERFVPGDLVEVAGFVDRSGPVASIRGAAARKTAHSTPAPPLQATPDTILRINSATTKRVEPGDYEGCLVGLGGVLLQSQPTGDGGILVIRSNEIAVTAESDTETFATLERIEPGTFVHLTGVARIDWGGAAERAAGNRPQRLRLLLRTVDDVRVVTTPSWWTPSRLAATVAVIGAILMAALAWVWLLRRQLQRATRLLGAEMRSRRDAAIEFAATLRERNRLAANLHDTLQQTIGGIGFQLDACEAIGSATGTDARRHFTVARNMVNHAAQELQGSVWAMRALPLRGKPLVDALRDLVARVGEGHDTAISVRADATFADLPEFVAGSVLLIVQEAVHNALRHGKPSRITVTLSARSADGTIGVRVEDDGPGFVVGRQAGPHDGHFGIQGMRERAERLGGTLSIQSRPGLGTVVEATVLQRDYDTAIGDEPAPPGRGHAG